MGRFYSIPFTSVAATAAQDLFEILAGTGKAFILHEVVFGQSSDAGDSQAEMAAVQIKRGVGATSGSGGSSVTPAPHVTSDQAAGVTAEINNTTVAVAGGGSITTLRSETFNVQGGYQYLPTPESRIFVAPAERLLISLSTTPADSLTISGTVVIEEL